MKKKISVLIFANDRKVNKKAIKMIDNQPCLLRIINSFNELSVEYSFRFIVFCNYEEFEIIEDEMSRWINDIIYIPTNNKDMNSSIFYNFINSDMYQSTNLVYITSLHFPLIDATMIKNFIDVFHNSPQLMFGEMDEKKISFWKQYFPSIQENDEGNVSINWILEKKNRFLYNCIMNEKNFFDLYNIPFPSNLLYYHCIFWSSYRLPNYFFKYEAIPFVEENDLDYIESFCVRKRNLELNLHLQKLWSKWKSIEERIARLEK
jgi:hypothetical protein